MPRSRERECSRKPKRGTSRKCLSFAHQPLLESAGDCLDDEVTYQLQESIVHTESVPTNGWRASIYSLWKLMVMCFTPYKRCVITSDSSDAEESDSEKCSYSTEEDGFHLTSHQDAREHSSDPDICFTRSYPPPFQDENISIIERKTVLYHDYQADKSTLLVIAKKKRFKNVDPSFPKMYIHRAINLLQKSMGAIKQHVIELKKIPMAQSLSSDPIDACKETLIHITHHAPSYYEFLGLSESTTPDSLKEMVQKVLDDIECLDMWHYQLEPLERMEVLVQNAANGRRLKESGPRSELVQHLDKGVEEMRANIHDAKEAHLLNNEPYT